MLALNSRSSSLHLPSTQTIDLYKSRRFLVYLPDFSVFHPSVAECERFCLLTSHQVLWCALLTEFQVQNPVPRLQFLTVLLACSVSGFPGNYLLTLWSLLRVISFKTLFMCVRVCICPCAGSPSRSRAWCWKCPTHLLLHVCVCCLRQGLSEPGAHHLS